MSHTTYAAPPRLVPSGDGATPEATIGATFAGLAGAFPMAGALPQLAIGDGATDALRELELLGQGGMGQVHAAEERLLNRVVAVKRPLEGAPPHLGEVIVQEARTLARLDHPNVVPVHALGLDSAGRPILVMKRIAGRCWSDLVSELDLERHLQVATAVVDALRCAHARGILHRDVKPQNVMVGEFGEVYLMDWGCACPLDGAVTTEVVGTPTCMAPEMVMLSSPIGPWTDVFLVGATLHVVLTGAARHPGTSVGTIIENALRSEPASYPAHVPTELAELLNRACARSPADRFQTMDELKTALLEFGSHRRALALTSAGEAALRKLEAAVIGGDSAADSLFSAARSRFRAALDGWAACSSARAGLHKAYELYVPWKLARSELAPVRALLHELPEPLVRRWAPVLEEKEEARRAAEKGRAGRDLTASATSQHRLSLFLLSLCVAFAAFILSTHDGEPFGAGKIALIQLCQLVLMATATWPFRHGIFGHPVSRTTVSALLVTLAVSALSGALAFLVGGSGQAVIRGEMLGHLLTFVLLGLATDPWLFFATIPYVVVLAVMTVRPDLTDLLPPFAVLPAIFISGAVFSRRRRASSSGDGAAAP